MQHKQLRRFSVVFGGPDIEAALQNGLNRLVRDFDLAMKEYGKTELEFIKPPAPYNCESFDRFRYFDHGGLRDIRELRNFDYVRGEMVGRLDVEVAL